jgi:hypothetical protein
MRWSRRQAQRRFLLTTVVPDCSSTLPRQRPTPDALRAYATATIVHLTGALTLSVITTVPWTAQSAAALAVVA